MFPFVKIDIFVQSRWSNSGKNFKPLTRLICELSIISINNFAKRNIFILTITSQQLFFTIENFKIFNAAVIDVRQCVVYSNHSRVACNSKAKMQIFRNAICCFLKL